MARNTVVNLDIRANADGFQVGGGTTARVLTLTAGGNLTLTGQTDTNLTIPNYAATTIMAYHNLVAKGDIISASAAATPEILTAGANGSFLQADSGEASGLKWASVTAVTYAEETGTSRALAVNEAVVVNNVALCTLTLPATAAFGSVIWVIGKGAGGFKIAQNAGQSIIGGNASTTTGVAGSLDSTHIRDCVKLVCVTADTDFMVVAGFGNPDYA